MSEHDFELKLIDFNRYIKIIAGDAILNYRIEIMNEEDEEYYKYFWSTDYTSDIHNVLTLWIEQLHFELFVEDNTPISFDCKVRMICRWYDFATDEHKNLYFNNEYYNFAHILDNMFSKTLK